MARKKRGQAALRFPEAVELEKIVDVPDAYVMYLDYADGCCDIVPPGEWSRVGSVVQLQDGEEVIEWFWRGLRPAMDSIRELHGPGFPVCVTSLHGAKHYLST